MTAWVCRTPGHPAWGWRSSRTLVRDDLHGSLTFNSTADGTQVMVRLPNQEEDAPDEL